MNSSHRITVTPDVVQILLNKSFQKKKCPETGQKISLSQAKVQVAKDYGFRDWQHLKDLEAKFKKKPVISKCDENIAFEGEVSIGEYEGVRKFYMDIEQVTFEDNFEERSKKKIGRLHGYIWDENEDDDIFWYLDRISDDLADFAKLFKSYRDEIEGKYDCAWIHRIAFIENLYVEPAYAEEFIGKAALKTFYNRLGSLVDAVFCQPVPLVYLRFNHGIAECSYTFDKNRIRDYEKLFEDIGFERVLNSNYFGRSNSQDRGSLYTQSSLEEL